MIVQKELLNKIKDFGLNSYEAKLWTALLSRGVATAGELSDIANVPRSRSYDVLESLERKGFVIMKLGKPIKYIAVPPSEVIERVKKNIKDDADKQAQVLEKLKKSELLTELNALFSNGIETIDPVDLTGALKGRKNIYNQLASMVKQAKKNILIMTNENGLVRKAEALKNHLLRAKERGVKIKIVTSNISKNNAAVKKLQSASQIKYGKPAARFIIVDNKNVLLLASDDEKVHPDYDFGVWVNTEHFAKSMVGLFDRVWQDASDKKK